MPAAHADLIAALKRELLFLNRGGYKSIPFLWRPALLLEDSPTCPARDSGGRCVNLPCPWLAFVALKYRGERKPCQHIVVGEHGETIDLLYRTATPEEYEGSFRKWLVAAIARLEQQNAADTTRMEWEGADMEFICKGCGKRKAAADEWLIVLEFEKPGTGTRNMVILAEWDDKRALDPRAAYFCSVACQKSYVAEHYGRVLVEA